MNQSELISKNICISGITGSGKSSFLKWLISGINSENSIIFIQDLKGIDFRKTVNNKNIFYYNEDEIFKIIGERLATYKDNPQVKFNDIYLFFDELTETLMPWNDLLDNRTENRKLSDKIIDLLTSNISNKIKVYLICATQVPNILLPSEICSKFDIYIDITSEMNGDIDYIYSDILKKELNPVFKEVCTSLFYERYITVYKIDKNINEQYVVEINEIILLGTNKYSDAYSMFIRTINKTIEHNFGFFGKYGLPYGFEAFLSVDDKVVNNKNLLATAKEIFNLFGQIKTLNNSNFSIKNEQNIHFKDEEWEFEFKANEGIATVKSSDGIYYLKTNVFTINKNINELYFNFCLDKVVSTPNDSRKLGQKIENKISLIKII